MKQYISLLSLWFICLIWVYYYYLHYGIHGESKNFYYIYMLIIAAVYSVYKVIWWFSHSKLSHVRVSHLVYWFLFQLLLVSLCVFAVSSLPVAGWILLFFKILFFLFFASLLWINFYCFWNTVLRYFSYAWIQEKKIQILASIAAGFTLFMWGVFLLTSFALYSVYPVTILFIITACISYKTYIQIFKGWNTSLKQYTHSTSATADFLQKYNSARLIDELHYIVITFLLSVNFVSIYRPFPIGWDDLWAYMNFPKLISSVGEHIALGKMYMWELYTGIGFIAGSQTFAFYLNSISGVIAAIVIYISISYFTTPKKQYFDLGLFSSMIFLMMPMVVFQLAKDMKLDIGLFIISIISLSIFYYTLFSKEYTWVKSFILLGIFIGVAFSIKVTSLLLLLWVLAWFFYKRYALPGFLSFIMMFIGVFSLLGVWEIINVVVPVDSAWMKPFGIVLLLIWTGIFALWVHKKNTLYLTTFVYQLTAIILWFIIALLPWGIKNISEFSPGDSISISWLLWWNSGRFTADYESIYSREEIEKIKDGISSGINASWTTENEDWGRYFWYEKWINNYLKLPWNLSFQVNQKGEFTDITYLFFIFIPSLFLFLPYRKQSYKYPVIITTGVALLYFIPGPISTFFTTIFSLVSLPAWYLFLIGLFLVPLSYMSWALDSKEKINQVFLVNLAFTTLYLWLWAVSSYGVVWYGIVMYFSLLLMINISLNYAGEQDNEISKYAVYTVLFFTWIYVFQSSIPHGINNLKAAGYIPYKQGKFTEEVALMSYHPEYFGILAELNISDEWREELVIKYRNKILSTLDGTQYFNTLAPQVQLVKDVGVLHQVIRRIAVFDFWDTSINLAFSDIRENLYSDIIYPSQQIKNHKNIYRVWTFLKYFISQNNTRFLEDSLLTSFQNYIYDENSNITYERFKKLGISYILLDLNAATIDRDPAKNLTKRYENMLRFSLHPNIELIETDSICLRYALDRYKQEKNISNYLLLAGVNYQGKYTVADKKQSCLSEILKTISNNEDLWEYSYLAPYKNALDTAGVKAQDTKNAIWVIGRRIPNGFKVLFKIR